MSTRPTSGLEAAGPRPTRFHSLANEEPGGDDLSAQLRLAPSYAAETIQGVGEFADEQD